MSFASLAGHNALITGASSGIGRHLAVLLARAGARVAVAARRGEALAALVHEIEAFDGRAMALALDVRRAASVASAVAAAETELGPITVLINNAGIVRPQYAVETSEADYDAVLDTNLKGAFLVATAVGRQMIRHGLGGRIVNVSSMSAFKVSPQLCTYAMAKAGLNAMTRCLAKEWARYDIRVNAICPGFVATDLNRDFFATERGQVTVQSFPRRRVGEPGDLDGAVLLLSGDAGRFITGSLVTIDDGQSL
ncbi:MAG: SDR family oxidoreductase [Alphaproteobacteria bacterium]|nr:SDR family oxidoreductase [Alphaproteobacteria bacterium]